MVQTYLSNSNSIEIRIFSFVDFSTLALREWFCREKLRCNRFFAPDLYEAVLPVTRRADGALEFGGEGEVIEWTVWNVPLTSLAKLP